MYAATVSRTKVGGSSRFDVNITSNGVDIGLTAGVPEIVETITPQVVKGNRQITHTLLANEADDAHLYVKAQVEFDGTPAWLIEVNCVPDATTPTGHAYWASTTCIDPSQPISITQQIN